MHGKYRKKSAAIEKFDSAPGGSLHSGLACQEKQTDTPEQCGMGTKGFSKNQVPIGPDKSTAKGPFKFC